MLKVRGTLLRSTVNYAGGHLSPDALKQWMGGMSPEDRAIIDGPPKAQEWYPADLLARLMESYVRVSGADAETEYAAMGRTACDDSLSAILPPGPLPSGPEYIVRRALSLWGHFYDQGDCEVHLEAPGKVVFRVRGIEHIHPTLGHRVCGWTQRALELAGAREPKVTYTCCSFAGKHFEEWRAVWKD